MNKQNNKLATRNLNFPIARLSSKVRDRESVNHYMYVRVDELIYNLENNH